jgi:VCBS repeat-containing protein
LLANDIDADNDSLAVHSVSATSASGAVVTLSGTNITYDPTHVTALQALAVGETATDTFDYTVSDGHGGTDTATVTLTVAGVNDAPVVQTGVSTKQANLANNHGQVVFDGQTFFGNSNLTVSDVDHNAQFGIAITGVDNANGAWEYWRAATGDWVTIVLQPGEALLLSADDKVRFQGSGSGDTEHLTFRAWDGTDGLTSGTVTVPHETGGATSFSSNTYTIGAKNVVIDTSQFALTEANGTTTITDLSVTDPDAGINEIFTVEATATHTESTVTTSVESGSLSDVAAALSDGVTYVPGTPQPVTDMVTLKVTDALGAADVVNFIFHQAGAGPSNPLTGTSHKDVIFATGNPDELTGGASADQFVFRIGTGNDTITDFATGQDHIDLRAFSDFVNADNVDQWLVDHASQANPADVLITLDGNDSITLKNVALTTLHASDFIVSMHHN